MLIGALFALLFGIFFSGPDFGECWCSRSPSVRLLGGSPAPSSRRRLAKERNFGSTHDRGDGPLRGAGRRGRRSRCEADPRRHAPRPQRKRVRSSASARRRSGHGKAHPGRIRPGELGPRAGAFGVAAARFTGAPLIIGSVHSGAEAAGKFGHELVDEDLGTDRRVAGTPRARAPVRGRPGSRPAVCRARAPPRDSTTLPRSSTPACSCSARRSAAAWAVCCPARRRSASCTARRARSPSCRGAGSPAAG